MLCYCCFLQCCTCASSNNCLALSVLQVVLVLQSFAGMGGNRSAVPNAQLDSLREELQQNNNGTVPHNFVRTAPGHDPSKPKPRGRMPRSSPRNPQTEQFLDMLGLPYNLDQQQPQTHAVASSPGVSSLWVLRSRHVELQFWSMVLSWEPVCECCICVW